MNQPHTVRATNSMPRPTIILNAAKVSNTGGRSSLGPLLETFHLGIRVVKSQHA